MLACMRGFVVDREVDHPDKRLEQRFLLQYQLTVRERHCSLRSQRFRKSLLSVGKGDDLAGICIDRIDQLQNADDFIFMVFHRHGEKGLRMISVVLIELPGAGKIKLVDVISVRNIDGLLMNRAVGSNHGCVWRAVRRPQGHRREGNWLARCAAHIDSEALDPDDFKFQAGLVIRHKIKNSAVSVAYLDCRDKNFFKQNKKNQNKKKNNTKNKEHNKTTQQLLY